MSAARTWCHVPVAAAGGGRPRTVPQGAHVTVDGLWCRDCGVYLTLADILMSAAWTPGEQR